MNSRAHLPEAVSTWGRLGTLALVYLLFATLGLHLAVPGTNATAVWIPTGIAMAAVLRIGPGVWPAIFLGAFSANVILLSRMGLPLAPLLAVSTASAMGNTAEALLAGSLITRFTHTRQPFNRVSHVLSFLLLGAALPTALSALIGTTAFCSFTGQWGLFPAMGMAWWVGDAVGALVVVPLLLMFRTEELRKLPLAIHRDALLTALLALAFWFGLCPILPPLAFLFLPLLVLGAFRLGLFYASALVALLAVLATLGTLTGVGPFVLSWSQQSSLVLQQGFIGTLAITSLVLNSALRERQGLAVRLGLRNRIYQAQLEVNQSIARTEDRGLILQETCRLLVELGGFRTVWVGFLDASKELLRPQASAGFENEALAGLQLPWDATAEESSNAGIPMLVFSDRLEPVSPVGLSTLSRSRRRSIQWVCPIRQAGRVTGALVVHHPDPEAFELEEAKLLHGFATDLGYALEALAKREELHRADRLRTEILDRVSDAFVALDKNWVYLFLNDQAAALFGRKPADLIGKHIWTEFPEGVGQPFHLNYEKALREQVPVFFEEYYQPWDRWFENRVYPSPEGVSIFFHEITERKRAERKDKESEGRYRATLENIELLGVILAPNASIEFCNDCLLRLTGWTREEALGHHWFDVFHPQDGGGPQDLDLAAALREGAIPARYESEIRTRSGAPRTIRWNNTTIRNAGGAILGTVSLGEDITEHRQAEASLRESEQRFASIYETVSDPIFHLAVEPGERYRFLSVNPAFVKVTGLSQEMIVGRAVNDVIPEPSLSMVLGHYRRAIEGKNVVSWEETSDYPTGRLVGEVRIAPVFNDQGECTNLVGTVHDLTASKQAEEALTLRATQLVALNALGISLGRTLDPGACARAGLEGILATVAPDTALYFHWEGEDLQLLDALPGLAGADPSGSPLARLGRQLCDVSAREGRPLYALDLATDPRCHTETCLEAGVASFAAFPLKSGDQLIGALGLASVEPKDFSLHGTFLETLAAQVASGLQSALLHQNLRNHAEELERRVEERTAMLREANEDLAKAIDHVQMADRAKSAFLAAMSHELRTPLNSVIGFTGVLLRGLAGKLLPQQEEPLRIVQRNGRHLLALINDVLDLSKIEAGEMTVVHATFDLVRVAHEALESLTPTAAGKGLTLTSIFAVETLPFEGDARRVSQILLNLLSNAVKFTEQGTVTLRLAPEGGHVRIAVHDTGPGIPESDLPRLFREFEQLDAGLARRSEGTGLGLALSRRLANLMGGDILVESRLQVGSVFTLILPRPGVEGSQ